MILIDCLKRFGLSDKEATVYIKLFELGAQSASVIGQKVEIPRSTSQFILNALSKKGFVRKSVKNGITYYHPESPQTLQKVLDAKAERHQRLINNQKADLKAITPLLEQIRRTEIYLPKVNFYEGVDNVVKSFFDFLEGLKEGSTIYNYVSPATSDGHMKKFHSAMKRFIKVRTNKNIKSKTICTYCEDAFRLQATEKNFNRKTLISVEKTNFVSEILLCEDRALDTSYSEGHLFSSLTVNSHLVNMRMKAFEMAWKQAIEDNKKSLNKPESKIWIDKYKNLTEY